MSENNIRKKNKKVITRYLNVNKKEADENSALKRKDIINLDNEIVIGLARLPSPKEKRKSENNHKNNSNNNLVDKKSNKKNNISIQQLKRRIIKKTSVFLFLIILLIGGIICFLLSPVFNIKTIEIENNKLFTTEQIIIMSDVPLNENIFKFSKKKVKNNLLSNSYIEDVTIKTEPFGSKVIIKIKEREATLMLKYGNSYAYINNQGYILEISEEKINVPILENYKTDLDKIKPGSRLNEEDLKKLGVILKILEVAFNNGIGNLITQINIKDNDNYDIVLESEDKIVYLGDCSNLTTKMLYVKEMLQRESGIEGEFFLNMDLNNGTPFFREKV